MTYTRLLIAITLLLTPLSVMAGDAERGALVAQARCATCHHLNRTSKLIGPSLLHVFGRKPTISNVPFKVWDAASLDTWLQNPRRIKPNTKMQIPPLAQRDRDDVIAWLKMQRKTP